jgi:hypothetical protein
MKKKTFFLTNKPQGYLQVKNDDKRLTFELKQLHSFQTFLIYG